jgi:hypothetical protein
MAPPSSLKVKALSWLVGSKGKVSGRALKQNKECNKCFHVMGTNEKAFFLEINIFWTIKCLQVFCMLL